MTAVKTLLKIKHTDGFELNGGERSRLGSARGLRGRSFRV